MFKVIALSFLMSLSTFADQVATRRILKETKVPEFAFQKITLEEAIEFLRIRSFELTPGEGGLNFNFVGPSIMKNSSKDMGVVIFKKNPQFKNKSLLEILDKTVAEANYAYSVTDFGIELHEKDFKPAPTPKANALSAEKSKELAALKIPEMTFYNSTLSEAAMFLSLRFENLDSKSKSLEFTVDPALEKQGVIIPRLNARDVSLKATLDFICRLGNLDYTMNGRKIILSKSVKPADQK